jgi:hypothetical protein
MDDKKKKLDETPGSYKARTGKNPARSSSRTEYINTNRVTAPLEFYNTKLTTTKEDLRKDPTSSGKMKSKARAKVQALRMKAAQRARNKKK